MLVNIITCMHVTRVRTLTQQFHRDAKDEETVRELRSIAKELKNADLDVVQQVVMRELQKEQHVYFFQGRKALWCYLIGSPSSAFQELLKGGINKFCSLWINVRRVLTDTCVCSLRGTITVLLTLLPP